METKDDYYINPEAFTLHNDGQKAVLLIHGFSGSAGEFKGFADYLFRNGYAVSAILLPGHGTIPEDMKKVTWKDWLDKSQASYDELQKKYKDIYIIGQSMGSLISILLGIKNKTKTVVVMSPPMFKPEWRWYIIPVARYFIKWYVIEGGTDPSGYAPPFTTISYPHVPIEALPHFLHLVQMVRSQAKEYSGALLIMIGKHDGIIPQGSGEELYSLITSKDKYIAYFEHSAHSLPVDGDREQVWEMACKFLDTHP